MSSIENQVRTIVARGRLAKLPVELVEALRQSAGGPEVEGRRRARPRGAQDARKFAFAMAALESGRVDMTEDADVALIAGQLADLTHVVEEMAKELQRLHEAAASQQTRADVQQERIDLAARELTEVSDRLQAAANALRQAV